MLRNTRHKEYIDQKNTVNRIVPVAMQASKVQIVPRCATLKNVSLSWKKQQILQIAAYGPTPINLLHINANCADLAHKKCWDMNITIYSYIL
jgi:hypothetical protein